jgi:tripartite-type tricarboxylate transporter receptor subunit TctC
MINRRHFTVAMTAGTLGVHEGVGAQSQSIRLIVGFPPGQSSDGVARLLAQRMSEDLGQTVWIDNKPGASGIISHQAAKAAPADGTTLLFGSTATLALNPALYPKLPYKPSRDFQPVALLLVSPMYLFASANSPVNNVKEFIAYVKARPGKVAYGSGGNGVTNHVAMEMLQRSAGLNMLHVPYKGSPMMITDLIGGQIEFAFEPSISILPMAQSGRVKLLGVASLKRETLTPDVPAIAEQVPGFRAETWAAIVAPKDTPYVTVQRLNAAINKALQSDSVKLGLKRVGVSPLSGTVADADAFIRSETERWGKAVRAANVQLD